MSATLVYVAYVVTGAAAGLMSGLFGIGGGLVMVPALLVCFAVAGVPADSIPALALGTSLTAICFASALASREHVRIGNLARPFSARMLLMAVFLALGVMAGADISTHLARDRVLVCIAAFQLVVAAWMFFGSLQRAPRSGSAVDADVEGVAQARLRPFSASAFLALTGVVSSIGGIGGATLMIPFFSHVGIEYRKAAALSTFFGCVIGAFGFVSFGILAHPRAALPMTVGYVSLPALASMVAGSYFLVRFGARLSKRLSKTVLTRGFCLFLVASGAKVLLPLALATLATR
jgi:hypothetical protein